MAQPRFLAAFASAFCLALAACGGSSPADPDPVPAAPAAATAPAPPVDDAASDIRRLADPMPTPRVMILSTNEPFYQARVAGSSLVLTDHGQAERRMTVDANEFADGQRRIRAVDGSGAVEIRLVNAPCQDSMSGAEYPVSGTLVVDGIGPYPGCARPEDMPPPGEPVR